MENIRGKSERVAIDKVKPNPWNFNEQSPETFEKQKHSLEEFALVMPVIVREIPGSDSLEIVDGEHRWRAAKELGWPEVAVWNLGECDDAYAQQLTILLNELHGTPNIDNLANLIKNLDEQLGRETIEMNLPFTSQQIADFVETLDFDWEDFKAELDDVEEGTPKIDMVRMEFRLPAERAAKVESYLKLYLQEFKLEDNDENRAEALEACLLLAVSGFM